MGWKSQLVKFIKKGKIEECQEIKISNVHMPVPSKEFAFCLRQFKNLSTLRMNLCQIRSIERLKCMPYVTRLEMIDNLVTGLMLPQIVDRFPNLQILVLAGNHIQKIESLQVLQKLPYLEYLDIRNGPIPNDYQLRNNYRNVIFQMIPQLVVVDEYDRRGNLIHLQSDEIEQRQKRIQRINQKRRHYEKYGHTKFGDSSSDSLYSNLSVEKDENEQDDIDDQSETAYDDANENDGFMGYQNDNETHNGSQIQEPSHPQSESQYSSSIQQQSGQQSFPTSSYQSDQGGSITSNPSNYYGRQFVTQVLGVQQPYWSQSESEFKTPPQSQKGGQQIQNFTLGPQQQNQQYTSYVLNHAYRYIPQNIFLTQQLQKQDHFNVDYGKIAYYSQGYKCMDQFDANNNSSHYQMGRQIEQQTSMAQFVQNMQAQMERQKQYEQQSYANQHM